VPKMVENLRAVGALPWTPLGELTALPQTPYLVGVGLLTLPKNPTYSQPSEVRPRLSALHVLPPMKNHGNSMPLWLTKVYLEKWPLNRRQKVLPIMDYVTHSC